MEVNASQEQFFSKNPLFCLPLKGKKCAGDEVALEDKWVICQDKIHQKLLGIQSKKFYQRGKEIVA